MSVLRRVNQKSSLILISWWLCLVVQVAVVAGPAVVFVQEMPEAEETSPAIKMGIEVLLNESVEDALRQDQAQVLLGDDQAHPALIELLGKNNNTTVKIIICQAIATGPSQFQPFNNQITLPNTFVEPLFNLLLSEDQELLSWAAQALAKCHDGVTQRLAQMVNNQEKAVGHRLAGIQALKLIYGKEPILALAAVLDDPSEQIQQKAADALAQMLYLPQPLNRESFKQQHLPQILMTDPEVFLHWQLDRMQERLWKSENRLQKQQEKSIQLRQKYLAVLTGEFESITKETEKLEFLKKHLHDPSEDFLRVWAVERFRDWCSAGTVQTGPIASAIVDLLKPLITDDNPEVRKNTAGTLELLVEKAQDTAPTLLEQLKREDDPQAQSAILSALGTFEYLEVAQEAFKLLKSEHLEVVAQASRALGNISTAHSNTPSAELVQKVAPALAQTYANHAEHQEVRDDLILGMRKIAAQQKYRNLAMEQFDAILRNALNDDSEVIRSHAVYALIEIHQEKVVPILREPVNLLDDPDIAVRLAAIEAYQKYPDKNFLTDLKLHLEIEKNLDVAQAIRAAFVKTLDILPITNIYTWALELKSTSHNRELELLLDRTINLLAAKISSAKTAQQQIPVECEKLVLSYQIQTARQEGQVIQAMNSYQALLGLKVPQEEKTVYHREILQFALENADNALIMEQTLPSLKQLLTRPDSDQTFQLIAQNCQKYEQDDKLLMNSVRIIAHLIVPLQNFPTEQIRNDWDKHRIEISLKLITAQEKLLAGKNSTEDPQAIKLLSLLDNRLKDYPTEAEVEKRQAKLEEYRRILQPPANNEKNDGASKPQEEGPNQDN